MSETRGYTPCEKGSQVPSPPEHGSNVSTIEDSGHRREFDTGAVRDMQEGKGRCDLLPATAILRLAKYYEEGCKKYGDRNWEKGIPISSYIDSSIRHIMKYLDGQTNEDHLCAAAWNLMCAMWTEEKRPDLQDIPGREMWHVKCKRCKKVVHLGKICECFSEEEIEEITNRHK
jgi:hypothetical protein